MKRIIIALVAIALIAGFVYYKGCLNKKAVIGDVVNILKPKPDTSTHWMDEAGKEHARNEAVVASYEAIIASKDGQIHEQAKKLNIQENQIKDMRDVIATSTGHFETRIDTIILPEEKDPAGNPMIIQKFGYSDQWISEQGVIKDGMAFVDYTVNVPISMVTYWKRSWFLGKKKYFIDGSSENPNVHISGLHDVQIKDKIPGRFGVGPFIGVNGAGQFSYGLAITYSLIRW